MKVNYAALLGEQPPPTPPEEPTADEEVRDE
jgi:hypothetical protein